MSESWTRRVWALNELADLRSSFLQNTGITWEGAINVAVVDGNVDRLRITQSVWEAIAKGVRTRTAKQCASRLHSERIIALKAIAQDKVAPAPPPVQPSLTFGRVIAGRVRSAPRAKAWTINGIDAADYIGVPSGRRFPVSQVSQ